MTLKAYIDGVQVPINDEAWVTILGDHAIHHVLVTHQPDISPTDQMIIDMVVRDSIERAERAKPLYARGTKSISLTGT